MEKSSIKKIIKFARLTLSKTAYLKRERTGLIILGDNQFKTIKLREVL